MALLAGASGTHGEAERAFLQRRIALFAKVAFLISLTADLLNLALMNWADALTVGAVLDRLVTVTFGAMWLICAHGERSVRFLRVLDAAGMAGMSLGIAFFGRYLAVEITPGMLADLEGVDPTAPGIERAVDAYVSMMVMLGGAVVFALRSAVIPSPPRFTLLVTGVFGLAFILVPTFLAPATAGTLTLRASPGPTDAILGYSIWWIIVTVTCTVTSSVIYGLRRDVRKAERLGQYTLGEKLGEGGMGAVYRASHALLRRPTAVKLLPPDKAGRENLERFEREVQLTATLTHPHTITIYDYGHTPNGVLYYAMELVDGPTLQEEVERRGPQPAARVAHILAQVAGALAEAHAAGLIHRDIKPANIMLCEQGGVADVVKVLDFGLVKETRAGLDPSLTNVDTVKGTPHYMSPEAIRSPDKVSAQSDVYALGAVGYFLLAGTTVFDGESVVEVCSHHLHTEPTPPSKRLGEPVPAALEDFILRCLDKDPDSRPHCGLDLPAQILGLEGVGEWTNADALAHSESAPPPSPAAAAVGARSGVGQTIAVDLADRAQPERGN